MRDELQSLDLHHLSILSLLLQDCSVTRVAEYACGTFACRRHQLTKIAHHPVTG